MLKAIINSKSKTFLAFCFSFLAGVAAISISRNFDISRFFDLSFLWLYLCGFFLIALSIAGWQNTFFRFFVLSFFCFLVGIGRYTIAFPGVNDISRMAGREMTVTGYVADEPDVRIDGVRYIIRIQSQMSNVRGQMYVSTGLYPRYHYGDILSLKCRLEQPKPIEEKERPGHVFRWDMYLARFGVFSVCGRPQIKKIGEGGGSRIMAFLLSFKDRVNDRAAALWHEPYASFMAGLLYGYRGGLGGLNDAFARTGVTHIVAVSGFNLSIIVAVLLTLSSYLRIRRQQAFYLILAGLIVFIIFTGASGSVLRAGVMAFLVLLAKQIGRLSRMTNVLAATAALLVFFNPFILIWDVGFQLSFLSTWGIVFLTPIFQKYTEKIPEFFGIKESFLTTMSAIIATLPLILYQFGRLSIVAPLVNVLILWIVPWLMLAGFVTLVASFLWYPIGNMVSLISYLGMKYIIIVVTFFSSLSFAALAVPFPWWGMLGMYVALGMVYRMFDKRMNPRVSL